MNRLRIATFGLNWQHAHGTWYPIMVEMTVSTLNWTLLVSADVLIVVIDWAQGICVEAAKNPFMSFFSSFLSVGVRLVDLRLDLGGLR